MANCAAWLSFTKAQAQALAAAEADIPAAFPLAAWLPSKPLKSIVLSPRLATDGALDPRVPLLTDKRNRFVSLVCAMCCETDGESFIRRLRLN